MHMVTAYTRRVYNVEICTCLYVYHLYRHVLMLTHIYAYIHTHLHSIYVCTGDHDPLPRGAQAAAVPQLAR